MSTDAELLRRYALDGSESAFARLFSLHEKLVLGVAYRRTGDLELARDVTQQVFAALAQKANQLSGRASVAGWLYQAARFQAAKSRRSMARVAAPVAELPEMISADQSGASGDASGELDEALAALGEKDREALLLHYFEDRSYPEMAATLNLSELACRKRVSRALKQLAAVLRKRGVATSASKLVLTAVAAQSTLPAQAIAIPALLSAPAAGVALPSGLFTTLMSHATLKTAAITMAIAAIPLTTQWAANRSLHTELLAREQRALGVAASSPALGSAAGSSAAELAALEQVNLRLGDELELARKERLRQESRWRELQAVRDRGAGEVVLAMDGIEGMAKEMGELAELLEQLQAMNEDGRSAPEDRVKLVKRCIDMMPRVVMLGRKVADMERNPEGVARFYATLFEQTARLERSKAQELETKLAERFDQLRSEGLAYPQRPTRETQEWDLRRQRAMQSLIHEVQSWTAPSPTPRRRFDAIVNGMDVLFLGAKLQNPAKADPAPTERR